MAHIIVADVMTRNPVTISPDTDLLKCAETMVKKKVGCLLLTDKKRLVGFLSEKDILWAITKVKHRTELTEIKASEISPRKIATISPRATIEEAIKKMNTVKFERLPVIHEGELVGMITVKDILNFNPEVYPEIEEFNQIREQSEKLNRIKIAKERRRVHEGICEECGNTDLLYRFNGMLVCENCRDSS